MLNHVLTGGSTAKEAAGYLHLGALAAPTDGALPPRRGVPPRSSTATAGRVPANRLQDDLRARLVELASTTYQGVNRAHLADLLAEREDIVAAERKRRRVLGDAVGVALGEDRVGVVQESVHGGDRESPTGGPNGGGVVPVDVEAWCPSAPSPVSACEEIPMSAVTHQAIRGIGLLTAMAAIAEAGDRRCFPSARHFMAHQGLVPPATPAGQGSSPTVVLDDWWPGEGRPRGGVPRTPGARQLMEVMSASSAGPAPARTARFRAGRRKACGRDCVPRVRSP